MTLKTCSSYPKTIRNHLDDRKAVMLLRRAEQTVAEHGWARAAQQLETYSLRRHRQHAPDAVDTEEGLLLASLKGAEEEEGRGVQARACARTNSLFAPALQSSFAVRQSSSRRCRCRCRTACSMLWTPFSSPAPKGRGQEGRGGLEHPAARGCASPRHAACGICGTRSPVNRVIS